MRMVENSALGRLWLTVWRALTLWYENSVLHRLLVRATEAWSGCFQGSRLMTAVVREGTLPRAWGESGVCRGLWWLVNLPGNLLSRLYGKGEGIFEGSAVMRLGFAMGGSTPYAIGWLTLLIIAFPYNNWNNMYALAVYVLLMGLFIFGGMRQRSQRLEMKGLGVYPVFFVMAVALGWFTSYAPSESFRFLFFHLTAILCVMVTVSAVEKPEHLMRLAACGAAAMAVIAAVGVQQGVKGVPVNYSYTDVAANAGMPGRVYSWYENPNTFAQVLVLLIPLALALILGSKTLRGKLFGAAASALGVVALLMTYSRASWVGLAVAAVVFLFFWKRKLLPGLLLLGLVCLPLLPDAILNRVLSIFNTKDTSTMSRMPLFQAGMELIERRPIRGAGLGTSAVRLAIAELNTTHNKIAFVHSHNLYLQLWLETGILGLVTFVAAMFSGTKEAARAVQGDDCPRQVKLVALTAMAAILGTLVSSMADYIWNYPRVMVIFWFVFALMLAGVKLAKKSARAK